MTNFPIKENEYGSYKHTPIWPPIRTDKKRNVEYWDELEGYVQEAFESVAECGGIHIVDLKEYIDIKELTEDMMKRIKKQFPEADWPYVDQDY